MGNVLILANSTAAIPHLSTQRVVLPYVPPLVLNETKNWPHHTRAKIWNNDSGCFYSALHPKIVTVSYQPCKSVPREGELPHRKVPAQFVSARSLLSKLNNLRKDLCAYKLQEQLIPRTVKERLPLVLGHWCLIWETRGSLQQSRGSDHGPRQAATAQVFTNPARTERANVRAWWVKTSHSCCRKGSQNTRGLCRQSQPAGKGWADWRERGQGWHRGASPFASGTERGSPGSARRFGLWSPPYVIVLGFQLRTSATSSSQIKSEMSFATLAKTPILRFVGLLKPFSTENKNNSKAEKTRYISTAVFIVRHCRCFWVGDEPVFKCQNLH